MPKQKVAWETAGYADILTARIVGEYLEVSFANGDKVRVLMSRVGVDAPGHATVRVEDGLSVRVNDFVVSWLTIRAATDQAFAADLRASERDQDQLLGRRLRALREDRQMTQAQLAAAADMSAARLAKIERGEEGVDPAIARTLLKQLGANFSDVAGHEALDVSIRTIVRRAEEAGAPRDVAVKLAQAVPRAAAPGMLARAFAWSKDELLRGIPRTPALAANVQFKAASKQSPINAPLVQLAYEVARLAHRAFDAPGYTAIPQDPAEIRREVLAASGDVTLATLLEWTWKKGIPVVPLAGKGVFAAAVFTLESGPAIVIKDARDLSAFWLFDLAHELGHVAQAHVQTALVDVDSPTNPTATDLQERAATQFALDLLLPGHAVLLEQVEREAAAARQPGVRFKFAVQEVARSAGVSPAILGIVAAFSLAQIGRPLDRWGSATNLAKPYGSGPDKARLIATKLATLRNLTPSDTTLIQITVLNSWNR